MLQVNMHEAKTHLSRLVEQVQDGEEVVIAKAGKPVARLVKVKPDDGRRPRGLLKGRIQIPDDFDDPLPDDILDLFEAAL